MTIMAVSSHKPIGLENSNYSTASAAQLALIILLYPIISIGEPVHTCSNNVGKTPMSWTTPFKGMVTIAPIKIVDDWGMVNMTLF